MDALPPCCICEEEMSEGTFLELGEKARKTLLEASKARKDEIHLARLRRLIVHKNCYKRYTKNKSVECARKRSDSLPTVSNVNTRSMPSFSVEINCVICMEDASDGFVAREARKSQNKRNLVRFVEQQKTIDSMRKRALEIKTPQSANILSVLSTLDLSAQRPRYHDKCMKALYSIYRDTPKEHYNISDSVMKHIFNYIEAHDLECQFYLQDILGTYEGPIPNYNYLLRKIEETFGDSIIISTLKGKNAILSYKSSGQKIISDAWYENRNGNEKAERLRIVEAAANIICEDIRSTVYDCENYPVPHKFLDDADKYIPESLKMLVDIIILKHKKKLEKHQIKSTALAHALISAARPRSFLSPILISVASLLHSKTGSKDLINLLDTLGFSASYTESTLFEVSAILHENKPDLSACFSQFVFDNADHNVRTLDGLNTFHAMGGIQCITPAQLISSEKKIPRIEKIPSSDFIGKFSSIKIKPFHKEISRGLQTIKFTELNKAYDNVKILSEDFLWLFSKYENPCKTNGWNGFLEQFVNHLSAEKSRIMFLPFLNAPPSNYDTIHTVLHEALSRSKMLGQKMTVVTFDQPLFWKAQDIISSYPENSEFRNIIVRLGGFHLLMSYFGAVGLIMQNSGLKDALCEVFAPNSLNKILDGHDYARALRAHELAHVSLAKLILSKITFSEEETSYLREIIKNICGENTQIDIHSDEFSSILNKFHSFLENLRTNGPTAQLWVQYFNMISLAKKFIQAERIADWEMHLNCIQQMIPYFHASGHYLYAKSAHLYVQNMLLLEKTADKYEYEIFTKQGYFTIRRSDKFRCGIWSDMTIEQTLMRTMHSTGGLTRGRGVSDNVLTKWILSRPTLLDVTDCLFNFCDISFHTSSFQHADSSNARTIRDNADFEKLYEWFIAHDPFKISGDIICISTGIIGDKNVNCHDSFNVGMNLMRKTIGKNFKEVKFERKNIVITLPSTNTIASKENNVAIDPTLLFQRICILKRDDVDLKNCFNFELAPYPITLFDESGMRKTVKSKLYDCFNPITTESLTNENSMHVIDGGFLLHRLTWSKGVTYGDICTEYVQYIKTHFSENCIIVFDGYSQDPNAKSCKTVERLRRMKNNRSPDISFTETMVCTTPQPKFLGNDFNKSRLIDLLKQKFDAAGFLVKQASEDADTLIVQTAINFSLNYDKVFIIGEDVDLLVILSQLASERSNVYFYKPNKGPADPRIYTTSSFKYKDIVQFVAFLHAFSGCDSTSAFYNQGKSKCVKLLANNCNLRESVKIFNEENASPECIEKAGIEFTKFLYGGKCNDTSLNEYRYECFKKSIARKTFSFATLPPTQEAVALHSRRVYFQLRLWQGDNTKNPEDWGWKVTSNGLFPVTTTAEMLPEDLAKIISCSCKKGCFGNCGCKKMGVFCTILCKHCEGKNCCNIDDSFLNFTDDNGNIEADYNNLLENAESNDKILATYDEIAEDSENSSISEPAIKKMKLI